MSMEYSRPLTKRCQIIGTSLSGGWSPGVGEHNRASRAGPENRLTNDRICVRGRFVSVSPVPGMAQARDDAMFGRAALVEGARRHLWRVDRDGDSALGEHLARLSQHGNFQVEDGDDQIDRVIQRDLEHAELNSELLAGGTKAPSSARWNPAESRVMSTATTWACSVWGSRFIALITEMAGPAPAAVTRNLTERADSSLSLTVEPR